MYDLKPFINLKINLFYRELFPLISIQKALFFAALDECSLFWFVRDGKLGLLPVPLIVLQKFQTARK